VQDLLYVAVMVAFVIIAALFVVACDRIIGPDDVALEDHGRAESEPEPQPGQVAA